MIDFDVIEDMYIRTYYSVMRIFYPITSKDTNYKIPKVCYQTWITKDPKILSQLTLSLIESNKRLNPDIEFQLWDDDDIDRFIREEFTEPVYRAYKSLSPLAGAAKADFFRYCVIYKNGGLYLDLKSTIKVPNAFGNIIQPEDDCILDIRRTEKEAFRVKWGYGSYEQWFLAFAPRHPYLKVMITRMVEAINNRIEIERTVPYKQKVMRLTGPDAYAAAIHESVVRFGVRHREVGYFKWLRYMRACYRTSEYEHMRLKKYDHQSRDESLYANEVVYSRDMQLLHDGKNTSTIK